MSEKKASESKLSYEAARDELAEIVESLEDGSASLEESLKLWERGEELAKICQEWLDGAKEKLASVKKEAK
jgi:exodeoxyribonuclease VII small subunit